MMVIIRRFWVFVRPYRRKFLLGILLLLIAVPLAQLALFLTRDVTNQALLATHLTSEQRWAIVLRIVGLQAIFYFSSAFLSMGREFLEWYCGMRATFDLRLAFYKHLNRMPLAYLSKRIPGEHLFRSTADMVSVFRIAARPAAATMSGQSPPDSKEVAMAIYSNDVDPYDPGVMGMIVRTVPLLIETLYALGWGIGLLFLIDGTLSWMLIAYMIPFAVVSHLLFNRIRSSAFKFKETAEHELGSLRDSIAGLRTLKALGRLKIQRRRYMQAVADTRVAGIRQIAQTAWAQNGAQMGMKWVFSVCIYVYLTSRVMEGSASLGDWIAAFLLIEAAQGPLENFVQILQLVKVQTVPAQRILETLDAEPAIVDKPSAESIGAIKGGIEFKEVSFSYTDDRPALQEISFAVKPGEYVGIVGPSGAGKSSVISLLLRLYDPDSGEVMVDGHAVSDIQIASLIEQVGTVPQTTAIFTGSIADNIRFGNPKATDAQVNEIARRAGILDYALRFDDGLDTLIGENSTLSGGERQRIGIARALIRNPRILVLDEATANLDPHTEAAILSELEVMRSNMTIISVAHRLKAVQFCDRILVLEAGKIAQSGEHRTLVAQAGLYQRLWRLQAAEEVLS